MVGPPPAFAADLDQRPTVTIASFSFPPLLHATKTGAFSGTMGETVKMLCEIAELTCKFNVVPLKRAYRQVKDGEADALITINIGQFKDCCVPSDWTAPWTAGFFSTAGLDAIPRSQDELIDKSIIIVHGMQSPYFFAKDLDKMAEDKLLSVFKAPNILTSVRMFLKNRASLLWGGEDFKWYIQKIDPSARYDFKPFFKKPVVIWVRKDKPEILKRFNQAFARLKQSKALNPKNLLTRSLMERRYIDAPLPE